MLERMRSGFALAAALLALGIAGCGNSGGASSATIGGQLVGLSASNSIVLQLNAASTLTVTANGAFSFAPTLPNGTAYQVSVLTQPVGQTCTIANGSGTVSTSHSVLTLGGSTINNVMVDCSGTAYVVGGSVSNLLAGRSLTLVDNGGNALNVNANGTFTFTVPLATGSAYAVTVGTPPSGQTCSVGAGSGTIAAADISNVTVTCTDNAYNLGVSVSGLTSGQSVSLQNNGAGTLMVAANGTDTFSNPVLAGSGYDVTVSTQPSAETCTVNQGSGTVNASNVTVSVSCSAATQYSIGGTLSGLTGTVILRNNGADDLSLTTNGGFTFSTPLNAGAMYDVTVETQPGDQTCTVGMGSGTVGSSDVTAVQVSCMTNSSGTAGNWIWQGGPDTPNNAGVYGTQGTASTANIPPSRYIASTWKDAAGNFWLFGGDPVAGGTTTVYNDLWMYSPGAGTWTWKSGADTTNQMSVFGTQNVAAAGNIPGARWMAQTWVDASGDVWLFGGEGCTATQCSDGLLNDLWMYSPISNEWTWVGGAQTYDASGVYGTQGTSAAGNIPGARYGAQTWADTSGNLWLFGGQAVDSSNNFGELNDLWRYNIASGEWTWMGGAKLYNGAISAVFGTQGVAAASNWPGATQGGAMWRDSADNFWMFGGYERTSSSNGPGADLWKYQPSTGLWTWVSGTGSPLGYGVFGTQGVAASNNQPGGRLGCLGWIDSSGNFWIYGGQGYSNTSYGSGNLADLWEYQTGTGEWTWVSGTIANDTSPTYGTLGVAAASNLPGARSSSATWADGSGNLWLFGGGGGYDSMTGGPANVNNDLWEYTP